MWPYVRVALVHAAFYEAYGLSDAFAKGKSLNLLDCGSYLCQTILKNPFTAKRSDGSTIVMFASGITNVLRGASYVNRLHDSLAGENPSRTLLIEDSVRKKYLRPRAFRNVRYHDLIPILAILESKIAPLKQKDEARINEFISFLRARFGYPLKEQVWLEVRQILRGRCTRLEPLRRHYDSLFNRLKPEIVFVEDGSYGLKGHIFKWAKARGIVTAELQHGLISRNHPAYNYGSAILSFSLYREYLPDYLLTFGSYWNEKTNTPSRKVTVGNPNLSQYEANAASTSDRKNVKEVVLIVSSGVDPEATKRIALELTRVMDRAKYEIILRPHPGEFPSAKEKYGQLESHGASIDLATDLYSTLVKADFVVGEVTTALFEATYFGKVVFAMDHPYTRLHIDRDTFPMVKTASDVAGLIAQKQVETSRSDLFWDKDWQWNYKTFMTAILNGERDRTNYSRLAHRVESDPRAKEAGA